MLDLELDSEAATLGLARSLATVLRAGDVIGLEGGLGAGKTTFARGVVHGLGVPSDIAVTSPTFSLLHHYDGRLPIAHADLYRLEQESELEELGLEELVEDGVVLLVEWGRKLRAMAEMTVLWVELEIRSSESRAARLVGVGARGDEIISAIRAGHPR